MAKLFMEGGETVVKAVHILPYGVTVKGEGAVNESREEAAIVQGDDDDPREGYDGSLKDLFGSDVQVAGQLIKGGQADRL